MPLFPFDRNSVCANSPSQPLGSGHPPGWSSGPAAALAHTFTSALWLQVLGDEPGAGNPRCSSSGPSLCAASSRGCPRQRKLCQLYQEHMAYIGEGARTGIRSASISSGSAVGTAAPWTAASVFGRVLQIGEWGWAGTRWQGGVSSGGWSAGPQSPPPSGRGLELGSGSVLSVSIEKLTHHWCPVSAQGLLPSCGQRTRLQP